MYGRHFEYIRKLAGEISLGVVVPGLMIRDGPPRVLLVPVVGPVTENDQVRVCTSWVAAHGSWVDIVTVIVGEVDGQHGGDVVDDETSELEHVVLIDDEIAFLVKLSHLSSSHSFYLMLLFLLAQWGVIWF